MVLASWKTCHSIGCSAWFSYNNEIYKVICHIVYLLNDHQWFYETFSMPIINNFTGGTTLDFYNFLARGFYSFRDDKLSYKSHGNRPFPKWSGSDWPLVTAAWCLRLLAMDSHEKTFRHKVRHNLKATILKLNVTQRSNFTAKVILYSPYQDFSFHVRAQRKID